MIICTFLLHFLSVYSKDMWFQVAGLIRPVVTIWTGFSPVCTLKWLLMFFFLTILKQIEHFDLPTSNGELSWNNHHLIELPFHKSNIAYQRLPKISVPKFLLNYFSYVCLCYIFTFLVHVFARYAFSCCSIV